jgi:hypothetical protein
MDRIIGQVKGASKVGRVEPYLPYLPYLCPTCPNVRQYGWCN